MFTHKLKVQKHAASFSPEFVVSQSHGPNAAVELSQTLAEGNRRQRLVLIGCANDSGAAEWERLGLFMYENEN